MSALSSTGFPLIELPQDALFTSGTFLTHQDLSTVIATTKALPPQRLVEAPSWQTVVRILVEGRLSSAVLPSRLCDIVQEELNEWKKLEGKKSESVESLQESFDDKISLLFQYSELAVQQSLQLGGDPKKDQLVWPMGCGSCSSYPGGYPWPQVVFSSPHFSTKLFWAGDALPKQQSRGLLLDGTFVSTERFKDIFDPNVNLGVLSWHQNDEEYFHPRQRNPTCEDFELFIQHNMWMMFSSKDNQTWARRRARNSRSARTSGNLIWCPYRALEQHPARDIMLERMHQSSTCSWLTPTTLEVPAATPNKHSVCFWVENETENRQDNTNEDTKRTTEQLEEREYDSSRSILEDIRSILDQMTIVPPLFNVDTSLLTGDWKLVEAHENDQLVFEPIFKAHVKGFVLRLALQEEEPNQNPCQLRVSIQIANSMGGAMTFLDQEPKGKRKTTQYLLRHTVHVGGLSMTAMSSTLDDLEEFVGKTLGKASLVEVTRMADQDQKLQLLVVGQGDDGWQSWLVFSKPKEEGKAN